MMHSWSLLMMMIMIVSRKSMQIYLVCVEEQSWGL